MIIFQLCLSRLSNLGMIAVVLASITVSAQENSGSSESNVGAGFRMTVDDLELTAAVLEEGYERLGGMIQFRFAEQNLTIGADEQADRMRIMIPVDQGILWSTYIHPLSSLAEEDFLSGIGQTINTASSFGTSFSSGELIYGGGDSNSARQRGLIEELLEKGRSTL